MDSNAAERRAKDTRHQPAPQKPWTQMTDAEIMKAAMS